MTEQLNHHAALIYVMVTMSAVDRTMTDAELSRIGEIVSNLPVFDDFDQDNLVKTAEACGEVLAKDGGLDRILLQVKSALPKKLRETGLRVCDRARSRRRGSRGQGRRDTLPRNAERQPRTRQAHHRRNRARHQGAQPRALALLER